MSHFVEYGGITDSSHVPPDCTTLLLYSTTRMSPVCYGAHSISRGMSHELCNESLTLSLWEHVLQQICITPSFHGSKNKRRVVQWVTHSFSLSRHSFRNRYASVAHSITVVEEWATDPYHNSALIAHLQNMFSKRKIEWEHVLIECDRVSDWSISQLSANSTTAEHVLKEKDWVRTCSDRVW